MADKLLDLDNYLKQLSNDIEESLTTNVAECIKVCEQVAVQKEVYDAYGKKSTHEPIRYRRRKTNGGLQDKRNMKVYHHSKKLIEITNETPANMKYEPKNDIYKKGSVKDLSSLVEYGDGENGQYYSWRRNENNKYVYGDYAMARPFTQATIDKLDTEDIPARQIVSDLVKKNYDIKRTGKSFDYE